MADKIFTRVRPLWAGKVASVALTRPQSTTSESILIQPTLETSFNVQINAELFAGYTYLAMANYFGRQCVALPGCSAFYMQQVKEEQGHAKKLIDFVGQRGGRVFLYPLSQPVQQEWHSPLAAFKQALEMETEISQKLLKLHAECQSCSDQFACNLIESEFLDHQVESVDEIARYIAQIERMGCDGLATHLFDQYLLSQFDK